MGDVGAELEKAQAALKAAEELNKEGLCDDAAGRLYYAAFHAARAPLWKEKRERADHTGARVSRDFVGGRVKDVKRMAKRAKGLRAPSVAGRRPQTGPAREI